MHTVDMQMDMKTEALSISLLKFETQNFKSGVKKVWATDDFCAFSWHYINFKTFETHRIHVKPIYSTGIQVVRTDS